ncbi:MAG TPA: hypothetical protein VN799_07560, partial [Acidimicrobiales bacterium]|nr:hypothetical protein [Acidimicrobiales bacterium]
MSPQLKSFEGPDVQLVLDRIRRELGPDAKINGAEKIRVGGVLGFFAKEHYRVLVEAPDAEPVESSLTAPATTDGGDVFSTMAEATDDVNDVGSVPPWYASRAPAPPPPFEAPPPAAVPVDGLAPASPATQAAETPGYAGENADSFDTVLSRVAHTLGDPPADRAGLPADVGNGHINLGNDPLAGPGNGHLDTAPTDGGSPWTGDEAGVPADIASRAAMFLAESAVVADNTVPADNTIPADNTVP